MLIKTGRARYAWVTLTPLAWLVIVTMTAGWTKLTSPEPTLGFLARATSLASGLAAGSLPAGRTADQVRQMIFNERLDAAVAAFFLVSVIVILADSTREWIAVLRGRKPARSTETPPEYAPESAAAAAAGA